MKTLASIALTLGVATQAFALPGDLDTTFNANGPVANYVMATAVQPDGKIIVAGNFITMGGATRNHIARLNADGSNDSSFNPGTGPNSEVDCAALQTDGKILIGGQFNFVNGTARGGLARLNANGTLDTSFVPPGTGLSAQPNCIAVESTGKVLVAGFHTSVNGTTRNRIARFNADGTLDSTTFGTGADNQIVSMALQSDGKILLGGYFLNFNSTAHNYCVRLNTDGTIDGTFTMTSNGVVYCIAVQPDGKIWFGGDFTTINSVTDNRLVRVNANGTTATALTGSTSVIRTLALQTDGKLLLGGDFTALNGQTRTRLARLNADGSLESTTTFNAAGSQGANNLVRTIVPQVDGKILVGGNFGTMNGITRNLIARLQNDSASQTLAIPTTALAQWTRTGGGPEIVSATFELSTDGGTNWSLLGNGTRTANGWDMSGLTLSGAGMIRARGRVASGNQTGSSAIVETIQAFNTSASEIAVEQPVNTNLTDGSSTVSFGSGMTGSTSAAKVFTIRNLGFVTLNNVSVARDGTASGDYTIDTTGMTTTVAPGATTSFSVTFTPLVIGTRTAALHIASDDADENPFDINLTGDGVVASQIAQQAYAKASNTGAGDVFGASVAIAGDTVVVGALAEDSSTIGINSTPNDSAPDSGAAYVFVRTGSTWTQQAYLKAGNTGANDQFGTAVAISGDTIVVGAPLEDSSTTGINTTPNESAIDSGAAYVFVRSGTTWTQQAYLKASNTGGSDHFGNSVAISGDSIVVGAVFEDSNATTINGNGADNSLTDAGAAYVFTRSGTTWTQQAYVKPSNVGFQDQFGISVAISGDTIVVGDYGDDSNATGVNGNAADNSVADSGAAFVFVRSGTTWTQQAYLKASNTRASDLFGFSCAIDGNTIVVGSINEDSAATGVNGNQSDSSATNAGAAYVYTRSGTTWTQQAYLKPSNTGAGDRFGQSIAISGDTIVVGANLEDSVATGVSGNESDNNAVDAGAAYVFVRAGSTWVQQAYLKASNTDAGDGFGYGVAVSGGTAVVGAVNEDSNAIGIGGTQTDNSLSNAGAAYLFNLAGPSDIAVEQPVGTPLTDNAGSIDFGVVSVTTTSAAKTFTITNTGVGPLLAMSVTKDGTNPGDYVVNTTGMSTTLAPGASTTFAVSFAPTAAGSRTAAVHIYSNDVDESPFDIAVTGTGFAAPEIAVEQPLGTNLVDGTATIDFGNGVLNTAGSPKTFTIRNVGNAALSVTSATIGGTNANNFSIGSFTAGSVAAGSSMTFTVTFTPSALGARSATLQIASDDADENPFDIALTGAGVTLITPEIVVEQPAGVPVTRSVLGWGYNEFGQTVTPPGLTDVAAIGAGNEFTVALKNDGTVVAWGWNQYGQTNVPAGLNNVKAIAVGNYHSVALKNDGTVVAWGYNNDGETNVPGGLTGVVAVAAGGFHSLALRSDGTVVAWGYNNHGQLNVPGDLTDVVGIDGGYYHSLALKADGTVVGWGSNIETQLNIPAGLTDVQSLASGYYFNFVLKTDGTAVRWGDNHWGQLNIPGGLTGLTALSSGGLFGSALKSDGTLVEWGDNTYGQTAIPAGLAGVQAIAAGGFHMEVMTQSVPFAAQATGTTSAAKTFVIRNTGNSPLNVSSVSLIGGNPSDFTLNTSGMASSVAAGGSTTFTVTFSPGAIGSRWTNLRILNDDPDESITNIALTSSGFSTANPNLLSLTMSFGGFAPGFAQNTTSYAAIVSNVTSSVTFVPTVVSPGSTITVNNNAVTSGSVSGPVNLNVGSNAVTIIVTAPDNIATKTYTLTITRAAAPSGSAPGSTDTSFNTSVTSGFVRSTVLQPDGKVIVCGSFTQIGGQSRTNLARLNADGSVESTGTFNTGTGPNNQVLNACVQRDGKIIVCGYFTSINGAARSYLARLNSDGTVENLSGFNCTANSTVYGALEQNDGKILIWGLFTTINGTICNRIARLNSDGSLESTATFDAGTGANSEIDGAALQPDGRILIGGLFTTVNGQSRTHIARLNADGSVESLATFNPGTGVSGAPPFGSRVFNLVPQPDGKIIIAGEFASVDGQARSQIARLNSDGSLESSATFNAAIEGGEVRSVLLQADGKIIVGGGFSSVNGQPRNALARLNSDGSVETSPTFDIVSGVVGVPYPVLGLTLQKNGAILVGGSFTEVNGVARSGLARVLNSTATELLTNSSTSRVEWLRGVSSPEVSQVTFDLSLDAGTSWTPLGNGSRISGGWELTGLSLPANGYHIRARGRENGGDLNGSSSLLQTITLVPVLVTDFRQTYFNTTSNTGNAANDADPDGDGIPNLVEYAFALNPTTPSSNASIPEAVPSGGNFGVSFTQPPTVSGITYGAEYSTDMANWFPVTDTGTGGQHVFSVPIGGNTKIFMRLVVTP